MLMNNIIDKNQQDRDETDMFSWNDDQLIYFVVNQLADYRVAFSTLIARHHEFIYCRCLFRLGNQHDAEDATQDIAIRVSNKLHLFQHRSQFKSWLSTVINNYCNTYAKRRARYVTSDHIQQLIEIHEAGSNTCTNASASGFIKTADIDPVERLAEEDIMHQALSLLSKNTQQLLTLRFYADKSLQEISQIMNLSLSATKARLYRAIEQLKNIYLKLENQRILKPTDTYYFA